MSGLNYRTTFIKLLTILITGIVFTSNIFAYRVEPLIASIEPYGSGSMMRIVITNTNSTPLIIELNALRVETNESDEVSRKEELKDILIFPAQTSIPPGREQVVQVRYVGDQKIDEGRVYAVRISQLPVSINNSAKNSGNEVKLGVNFLSHILVQNKKSKPVVEISEITRNSEGGLSFKAINNGNATALIKEASWSLTDGSGKTVELDKDNLDTGSFGALISGAPQRTIKINAEAIKGLNGEIEIAIQNK